MSERFSPEYIDFVTESEPIQAAWQKRGVRVGDWVYGTKHNNIGLLSYHLVQRTDLTMTPALAVDLHDGEYYVYGTAKTSRGTPVDRIMQDWRWLPTLSDLLETLESLGNRWEIRMAISGYWIGDHKTQKCETAETKELAAARLLERVLTGKEERDETV